ncbi:eukaryotic translation elongation factor 1 epsilon-1 [Melitaea cinxia]|uniref:eukaryotic translation elongation factor 1 epsilon-1 n=1 Tax=Melitaea cinxia TaxID=113334 RepID=UPI001E274D31|nr:eukaryotic translation elongation factor 1 epsilon-1 [Melitaea cinxia]
MEVVKYIGKYLNTPVGTVCYNTDKVLTTILDKENVEGFASIILKLVTKSGVTMSPEQRLLSYQWLEHLAVYSNQAVTNPTFAKNFLQGLNATLENNTYLIGNHLTITDIAAYHVLYPLIERLTVSEQESLLHVCRWSKHVQSQPKVSENRSPLSLNTLTLSLHAPVVQ